MTIGVTGVVWMSRGARVNSTLLGSGAGAAPLGAAGPAWAAVAEGFVDASATLARVMQELATGWEGDAAATALARLAPFAAWTEQSATLAADTAAKATTAAGAFTTAILAMPGLPEIDAVRDAKAAAYSTGGIVHGAAAAEEVAERALDVRAALVMQAYEAASSALATTVTFALPPALTAAATGHDVAASLAAHHTPAAPPGTAATTAAFVQNPSVAGVATQVGAAADTVSGAGPEAPRSDPAGAAARSAQTPAAGAPVAGAPLATQHLAGDAQDTASVDRTAPGYRQRFEHFSDGRTVAPSVLGADRVEDGQ